MVILIKDVWHQLTTLDPGKSEGPDGCHPHVLGEVKEGVVTPLDLQKAFDKVAHARLLSKLESYGTGGKLLQWIEKFLSNTRQCVHLCRSKLDWINIFSGVPQGSILGPFLFIVYVNDMPNVVSSDLLTCYGQVYPN